MTVAKPLATVAKLQGRMNFIKYKNELVNLDLCTHIFVHYCSYDEDYIIFFDNGTDTRLPSFRFKNEKERDEYFLKIQKKMEYIQGFNVDLAGKND